MAFHSVIRLEVLDLKSQIVKVHQPFYLHKIAYLPKIARENAREAELPFKVMAWSAGPCRKRKIVHSSHHSLQTCILDLCYQMCNEAQACIWQHTYNMLFVNNNPLLFNNLFLYRYTFL